MSLEDSITITGANASRTLVDPQVFAALVRKMVLAVSGATVHIYMDNQLRTREMPDVFGRLIGFGYDPEDGGVAQGMDAHGVRIQIAVTSRGWESGGRTNDNRVGAAAAAIARALDGMTARHEDSESPDGVHTLTIESTGSAWVETPNFEPAGVVVVTATGQIDRDAGDSVLAMPDE